MINKRVVLFVLIMGGILTAWALIDAFVLTADGFTNTILRETEAWLGSQTLNLLGYESTITKASIRTSILVDSVPILDIANSCNALVLFVIYSAFILAFPGSAKNKLVYLAMGNASIYVINIIRIVALLLIKMHAPQYLDFNHHFTFQITVYVCIFLYWKSYVKKNWDLLTSD